MFAGCAQMAPDNVPPGTTTVPTLPIAQPAQPAPPEALEPPLATTEARPPPEDAERLLSYFERLKRLSAAELVKEHEAARVAYGRANSDFNRLSYATILALPGTAFNDDARALDLLDGLIKRGTSNLRPYAMLLATFVQERRRLGGELAAVQQKLDALKLLERKLIERDQNNTGRK